MELDRQGGGGVFRSPLLSRVPGLVHGISTRELEEGLPPGASGEDLPALAPLLERLGWRGEAPVRLTQVHGAAVLRAERAASERPEADAAVTAKAGVLLLVRVADCIPLILAHRGGGAVAVVHAGWRGVAAGVVERGVEEILRLSGGGPDELLAALGPGIGACCFEVGQEVIDAVAPGRPRSVRPGRRGRPMLDLRGVVADRLLDCGLSTEAVDPQSPCTSCGGELLHSFRRDGEAAGRLVAVAGYAVSIT